MHMAPLQLVPNPAYEPYKNQDLNTIPLDAPIAFLEPSWYWVSTKSRHGAKFTTITSEQVPPVDLTGKNIIVSGSNNGIGREAALRFASWGANLTLACRNPPPHETHPNDVVKECQERAAAAGHKITVEWWPLDMSELASVEAFCKRWLDTGKPIDILCNNAGMGSSPGGGKVFKTKDGFEIIHQVNFISHVLLTMRLLPCIAKAAEPRIVCTTSCFHYPGIWDMNDWNGEKNRTGAEGVQFYQNNKLYFQTWLTELQARLLEHQQYKHITVNGIHPGYVNSGIWNLNAKTFLNIKEYAVKILAYLLGITPEQGSLAIVHAATSFTCGPDPAKQGVGKEGAKGGGRYFNRVWEDEPMPHTRDPDCRLRVWRKVNEELGLEEKGLLDVLGVKAI